MGVAARRPLDDPTTDSTLLGLLDEATAHARAAPLSPEVVAALLDVRALVARSRPQVPDERPEAVSLHVAATTIGVTASRLRRWADAGQIRCTRTAGGHRRFPLSEVQRLVRERGRASSVLPVPPPRIALPALAELLEHHGEQLFVTVRTRIYGATRSGWLADAASAPARADCLRALIDGARTGDYDTALAVTEALLREARLHAAGLLERYRFVDQLGRTVLRALHQSGADKPELAGTRQLCEAIIQAHLADA